MLDKEELGKRIKKVREDRHMTLKNIEAEAGISATHISEIERGKTSPTLGALIRIAKALGKEPAYFIEDRDLGDTSLVTVEDRIRESMPGKTGAIERLTSSIPGGRLQGSIISLEPGASYHREPHSHQGNEAALVLKGEVRFQFSSESHELAEGDSILYDANEPHAIANGSHNTPATLVWFCTERDVT